MGNALQPFRSGTRQRRAKVGVIAYAAAQALTPLEMPRVGMLSRIYIQFRGTVTLSGAGALSDLGPWNLLARLRINANIGSAALWDTTGYGAYLMTQFIDSLGFRPDVAPIGATVNPASVHASPVASGANVWVLSWVIPISANDGREFDLGLVNLQAPETRVTVELTTGALLDPATLVTATTGNFHVYYEYYEIPDPRVFQLPPLALVRTLEESQALAGTGDNIYTVPRQGVLLQLLHSLRANGLRSDGYDSISLRYNKTDTVYSVELGWQKIMERMRYGMLPPAGTFVHDLWHAASLIAAGDTRDAIDTEELSTLESICTVSSGTTLGSNNNFLVSIRRIVQTLE
jgi:hypothetical protein